MGRETGNEQPVFDFSRISWKQAKDAARAQALMQRGTRDADVETLEQGYETLQSYLARAVVSVPRTWLVDDAPGNLDWGDPASFDWVRSSMMGELIRQMGEAQAPAAQAKN